MPRSTPLSHGDITIYKVPGAPIPIVHRVIETHNEYGAPCLPPPQQRNKKADQRKRWSAPLPRPNNTDQWILTKGDNNPVDDVGLYRGMRYLKRSHLVGKVQACVPISVLRNERHLADDARRSFSLFWPNQLRPLRRLRHNSHGARGGPSLPFSSPRREPSPTRPQFPSLVFGAKRTRR